MHMLLTWMTPSVSLTIIAITWFGVVGDSFFTVPIDKKKNSLYRMRLATLRSLNIVLLLVMTHIFVMMSLTVSLTTMLFSVDLWSLTS